MSNTRNMPAGPKVLRSQKQPRPKTSQIPPAPTPKPTVTETVTLASGEKRPVRIEATNDKELANLLALIEADSALSLDHRDVLHRRIAAIAALRVAHEDGWKSYCEELGMKWPKEIKSEFRPAVMWALNKSKEKTGESHTAKASMIAGCLDEYWVNQRHAGMQPNEIPEWLEKRGGYTKVYRDRLDRLRDPKDKIADRYERFLALPPQEQREIPDWLSGYDGEVLISAHIDRSSGKLKYRSVLQPEGNSFWYNRVDQLIAARPEYQKAIEPVRVGAAERSIESTDELQEAAATARPEDARQPTAPVSPEKSEGPEPGHGKPLDPEIQASLDSTQANFDASMADVARSRTFADTESIGSSGVESETPPACKLPRGCRYGGCRTEGRCLSQPDEQQDGAVEAA